MRAVIAAVAVAALAWVAAPAGADAPKSMGEAAAKDKDKKKGGKVYTEDDLRGRRNGGTVSNPGAEGGSAPATDDKTKKPEGGTPGAGTASPAPKEKTEDELRAERQADWRSRLEEAQTSLAHTNSDIDRLQASLADNTQAQYGPARGARQQALDAAKAQQASLQAKINDLQEEGRRNGWR